MRIDLAKYYWPIVLVVVGCALNFAVMYANGGMPVPGITNQGKWVGLTGSTWYPWLGDVLPLQFSIGDVLMIAGLVAAVGLTYLQLQNRSQNNL